MTSSILLTISSGSAIVIHLGNIPHLLQMDCKSVIYCLLQTYYKHICKEVMDMGYRTVGLPSEMVDLIQRLIRENKALGFKSVGEFVKDAVRRRLEEIKNFEEVAET